MTDLREDVASKIPPSSASTEAAVLGAMLLDKSALVVGCANLIEGDFYLGKHALVFRAMLNLYRQKIPGDTTTIAAELEKLKLLSNIGGRTFLAQLLDAVATTSHIKYHCDIVREKSAYRQMILASTNAAVACYDQSDKPLEVATHLAHDMARIMGHQDDGGLICVGDELKADLELIEGWQKGEVQTDTIKFGMVQLDKITGGMPKGHMVILAGAPRMGKTSLGLQIAANVAKEDMFVAVFSLELTNRQLRMRLLSQLSGVGEWKLKNIGGVGLEERNDLDYGAGIVGELPMYVHDKSGITVEEMRLRIQERLMGSPPDLILIDYVQKIQFAGRGKEKRHEELSKISDELRVMAKDMDCVVLALSQMNRDYKVDKKRSKPLLTQLAESSALERDSRLVLAIDRKYQDDSVSANGRIYILKNTFGNEGSVEVHFTGNNYTFTEGHQ